MRVTWQKAVWGAVFLSLAYSFYHPVPPLPAIALEEPVPVYPKDYFMNPVDDELRLAGTFCELRPGHFHSGIDIKSKTGGIGQPVFAAADGFIDKIKVQANGYGNVLYVRHPNGYTTLYGHLDRFAPEIQKYVLENQYNREQFEIELSPADGQFRVRKGEEIGKMGNSGSSQGPHLHFEIRNTATGKALNPLLFGLPVVDKTPPEIRDMKVYFLNDQREVMGSKAFPVFRQKNGTFGLNGDTVYIGGWRVGFGVKSFDMMNNAQNDNGIYSVQLYSDEHLAYEWRGDDLEFEETRYLNAHIDYAARQRFGAWFHRCFVLPGNRLSQYARTQSMGAITLFKEKPVKITLKVSDAAANTNTLIFWVLRDESAMETFLSEPYQMELPYNADSRLDLENFSMQIPKGALYETLKFQYGSIPDDSKGVYSAVHHVHDNKTPVQRNFELSILPERLPAELRAKAVIVNCGEGRPDNCGGTWRGDFLTTRVREFGNYCIMADTEPPTIKPVIFDQDMRRKKMISFRIYDNFAVSGEAQGLSYRGTIDGQWVLFEYDKKRSRLAYTFDGRIGSGTHVLKLVVKDDKANEAVFERKFVR